MHTCILANSFLNNLLLKALLQNADLKLRLSRIHADSLIPSYPDIKQTPASPILSPNNENRVRCPIYQSLHAEKNVKIDKAM